MSSVQEIELCTSPCKIQTLPMWNWFIVKKNPPIRRCLYMLYFHVTTIFPAFRSALFRNSYIHLPLQSTKLSQIKKNNSCKVQTLCTIYIIFISKVKQLNNKLRLVMWSVTVSKQDTELSSVGFWHAWITFCLIFDKDC